MGLLNPAEAINTDDCNTQSYVCQSAPRQPDVASRNTPQHLKVAVESKECGKKQQKQQEPITVLIKKILAVTGRGADKRSKYQHQHGAQYRQARRQHQNPADVRNTHLAPPEQLTDAGKKDQCHRERQGPVVVELNRNSRRIVTENAPKNRGTGPQDHHGRNNA